ncbi:MAG: hypothetical protein Q9227_006865 [Pyrenula ochraceoflavens]
MNPSFVRTYKKHCERIHTIPNVVDLDSGAQGFWLGSPEAPYVLVYSHGGGFGLGGDSYHIAYLERLRAAVGPSLSIFVVAYTLVPFAVYPQQIREALSALQYILAFKSPSQVFIGGDSSGANLCLAVISHLLHPHPEIDSLELNQKLRGMILLSPWVSFDTRLKSSEEGKHRDVVNAKIADKWVEAYMGGRKSDLYMNPVKADIPWWENAPVEESIVLAGGSECSRDAITVWVGKWEFVNPNTTFVLAKNEVLDAPIYDSNIPGYKEMLTERAAKEWLKPRVEWTAPQNFRQWSNPRRSPSSINKRPLSFAEKRSSIISSLQRPQSLTEERLSTNKILPSLAYDDRSTIQEDSSFGEGSTVGDRSPVIDRTTTNERSSFGDSSTVGERSPTDTRSSMEEKWLNRQSMPAYDKMPTHEKYLAQKRSLIDENVLDNDAVQRVDNLPIEEKFVMLKRLLMEQGIQPEQKPAFDDSATLLNRRLSIRGQVFGTDMKERMVL